MARTTDDAWTLWVFSPALPGDVLEIDLLPQLTEEDVEQENEVIVIAKKLSQ